MKFRMAVAALLLCAVASQAEAGIFSFLKKPASKPKAASPVLDAPLRGDEKINPKAHVNYKKYNDPRWGSNWERWLFVQRDHQLPHWAEY